MSNFESIFTKNEKVDPNLNALFERKIEHKPKKSKKSTKLNETTDDSIENSKDLPALDSLSEESSDEEELNTTEKKLKKLDPETERRTVFVGNLNTNSKKEELLKLFKSYGKIESVRFRNVVPEDLTKPKRFAFITKQQHPNKKTINAFIRFADVDSAQRAAEETNGMEYKSLHLRVDIANKSKAHDNKRSLFLGALPFDVADEDVYAHFASCGPIEYVRIIRDNKTGIGKGFGYVQFKTSDTVALGLKLDGSVLNERKIRVSRCVRKQKLKTEDTKNSKQGNKFQKKTGKPADSRDPTKFKNKPKRWMGDDKSKKFKKPNDKKSKDRKKLFKKKTVSTNNKNKIRFKI